MSDGIIILKNKNSFELYIGQIENIYVSNGWGNYYPEKILRPMFANSYSMFAVGGGRLVGFLRAFGDATTVMHLSEIIVEKNYQRKGVGRALLQTFLQDYSHTTVYAEALEKTSMEFFEKSTMKRKPQLLVYAARATI